MANHLTWQFSDIVIILYCKISVRLTVQYNFCMYVCLFFCFLSVSFLIFQLLRSYGLQTSFNIVCLETGNLIHLFYIILKIFTSHICMTLNMRLLLTHSVPLKKSTMVWPWNIANSCDMKSDAAPPIKASSNTRLLNKMVFLFY